MIRKNLKITSKNHYIFKLFFIFRDILKERNKFLKG